MKRLKKATALLLVLCLLVQPLTALAASAPENGSTSGVPFTKGTAGSNSFRIPSLVTLSDGTLVAAADARWNTTYDGGGLDTIVSTSSDDGANWNYTFANYLGDNGNEYNGSSSTCFIDPAMAVTSDDTIYMLVDLYPYGVALNGEKDTTPDTKAGFDSKGRLLLSGDNHSTYGYYLENGKIYSASGEEQSGYEVDEHFNITGNNVESNLFFKDSPFKVVRTGFLYLTKSSDKGKTWSAPTLLNLKTTSEQVCLVGPGRGLVTDDGMIVFPCYSFHGDNNASSNTQRLSFIYSTDGTNWERTSEFNYNWASEAAVVELNDGTLRFFFRNGTTNLCYVDYNVIANTWGSAVSTGIDTNSNCQISAITYSKTVDGKQVLLVSCPTGPNEAGSNDSSASARLNGKIFVGLVNADKTISWQTSETIDVASKNSTNYFMYSCLTELKDGKIAILYEDNESNWGTGENSYYQMSYATYDFPMTADASGTGDSSDGEAEGDNDVAITNTVDITLAVGETSEVYTDTTGNYESTAKIEDTTVATMDVTGVDDSDDIIEALTSLTAGSDNKFYIQVSEGTYLTVDGGTTTNLAEAELWYANAAYTSYCTIRSSSNGYYLGVDYNGVAYTGQSALYMKMSNGVLVGYYSNNPAGTPVKVTAGTTKSTEVTFTGVKPGTTTAVVGTTQYNITVNKIAASASVAVGGTATFSNAGTKIGSNTNNKVATATISNGVLTVNAIAAGTTTITTDYGVYTITVSDGTPISIKEKETMELSVTLEDGQYVEWSTADSSCVGVAGKYNPTTKKYTDTGVIIGHNVTDTPVVVIGTIYNADGTKAGTQKWLVTVTEGDADTNTSQKHIYVNVTAIENCTVYYAVNGGELVKINGTGILVDEDITGHYNIMFFADPDEGYALTYMSVSGSAKQYYTLSDGNPDGTGSGAWPFDSATQTTIPSTSGDSAWVDGHGFRWSLLEGNMEIEQMKLMFSTAIALGCDGATNFTKNANESFYTEVQFAAQKLPTLEKEIVSITRENGTAETYTEGMKVNIGDTVNYKINIQEYAEKTGPIYNSDRTYTVTSPITSTNKPTYATGSYGTITYSNESLVDPLTGDSWSPDLGTSSTTASTHTYDTSVTLTKDNFNTVVKEGKITNTADLEYDYTSNYSTGTLNASASAVAEITVEIPSYVIDFGLPVTFDLSELALVHGKIKSASATYGDVSVSESNVTYTPNKILKGVDYVNLELTDGHYAIAVYPATTVYYEEGFATGSKGDWKEFSIVSTLKQLAEKVGDKINIYGLDGAYTGVGPSNGTQAESDEASIGTVTFTGTGVDIYTNNTPTSGVLMAWVKNSAGNTVKVVQVDTHMESGENSYTSGQDVKAYNVPVVSIAGLERGNYTVELRHIGQSVKNDDGTSTVVYKPVALDGYRVHGTIDYATDAYVKDLEDNPTFIEVRDKVLAGLNVTPTGSEYAKDIAKDALAQVYATAQSTEGAVVLSNYAGANADNVVSTDVQDLLDNGPKNELYLRPGESVAFKVATNRVTQIGLKALENNITSLSLKANGTTVAGAPTSLTTSTDMFYKLADQKSTATETTYTITNNGGGILSITELKICDDANVAFEPLTEDDLIPALNDLGYETEEPEYADAILNIVLNDASGKALASTELTANGIVGEENTFSAATIEETVATLVPEGYELKDAAYVDQEVAYGENVTVTFTAEKVATQTSNIIQNIINGIRYLFGKWFG